MPHLLRALLGTALVASFLSVAGTSGPARAEEDALAHKRLSGQINLLRQIFAGTIGLVVMLGILVVAQWATGTTDPDGLAMVERVLLVLTGILGSAMASVFDSRNRDQG